MIWGRSTRIGFFRFLFHIVEFSVFHYFRYQVRGCVIFAGSFVSVMALCQPKDNYLRKSLFDKLTCRNLHFFLCILNKFDFNFLSISKAPFHFSHFSSSVLFRSSVFARWTGWTASVSWLDQALAGVRWQNLLSFTENTHWDKEQQSKAQILDGKYRQMALIGFDTWTTELGS